MKSKTLLLVTLISLIFFHCKKEQEENLSPEEVLTQTPEVLGDNKSDFSISSFSKRWHDPDIISKLYSEALEKNKELNLLNEKIKEFTNDSVIEKTKSFTKYSNINNRYWVSVDRYTNSINDSILKKETASIFNKLKLKYENSIENHTNLIIEIDDKKKKLRDQLTLMKLVITQPMMSNYQINEKPNIEELEQLISQYKKLIEETKVYTKTNK